MSKVKLFTLMGLTSLFLIVACDQKGGGGFTGLSSQTDSISYAIGLDIAKNITSNGVELSPGAMGKGVEDFISGETLMDEEQKKAVMNAFNQQMAANRRNNQPPPAGADPEAAANNLKAGQEFMAANKSKEGIKTHPSGMQYRVIKPGTGASPAPTDKVTIHYKGSLTNGEQFDSSYDRGQPSTFPLQQLVKGWQVALPMMKEGGKWEIFLPPDLAYGPSGRPPQIPPNSTLVFEIELFEVPK